MILRKERAFVTRQDQKEPKRRVFGVVVLPSFFVLYYLFATSTQQQDDSALTSGQLTSSLLARKWKIMMEGHFRKLKVLEEMLEGEAERVGSLDSRF